MRLCIINYDNDVRFRKNAIKDVNKWFKKVKWKPMYDDIYYAINLSDLTVCDIRFTDNIQGNNYNNCFQTRKEAEEKLNKIKEILNN